MSDEAEWRPPLHSLFVLSQCWNNQNNGVHELEFHCVKRGSPGQDPSHEASLPPRSVRSDLRCDADCPEVCGSTTSAARPVTECSRRTSDQGAHVPDGPIQVPQVEVIVEIVQGPSRCNAKAQWHRQPENAQDRWCYTFAVLWHDRWQARGDAMPCSPPHTYSEGDEPASPERVEESPVKTQRPVPTLQVATSGVRASKGIKDKCQ